jgi:hypothetical protein
MQSPPHTSAIFHLSTPVAAWWDYVIHACASFQTFHAEAEADAECERHALPKGAVMMICRLRGFAPEQYGVYLATPWRKRPVDEARTLFARHGLTSSFWAI